MYPDLTNFISVESQQYFEGTLIDRFRKLKYKIPDEETQKEFVEWIENFKNLNGIYLGNEAHQNEFNQLINKIEIKPSACFRNSQLISSLNKKYDYYEGVYGAQVEGYDYTIAPHAFNITDGKIKDFTSLTGNLNCKFYFGIEIPIDFVETFLNEKYKTSISGLADGLQFSFLLPYFYYAIKKDKENYLNVYHGIDW